MNKPIATISRTNEILKKFDMFAKKSFGQNFITEPNVVSKIAALAQCDDIAVIEIGPGIGALSEQLALRAKKVIAYEIDERLPEVLSYSMEVYDNFELRMQDFLNADLVTSVDELKKDYGKVVLCANLPYYITTPLLFKIFDSKCDIPVITVMMQKEVGDRMSAKPSTKDYNALSVIVQFYYDVKTVMKVPRTVFNPKPNVDSSVVQFVKKEQIYPLKDEQLFSNFVKACFKQRRKTLMNNLREYLNDKDEAVALIQAVNLEENVRAENLSIEQFIQLCEVHYDRKSIC